VGIIMGSDSDLPVMQAAADALAELGVPFEMTIVSAHRTPQRLYDYADSAVGVGSRSSSPAPAAPPTCPAWPPPSPRCRSSACPSRAGHVRAGLAAVHRADAARRAGGHRRHRRRPQRRPPRGADPGRRRRRRLLARVEQFKRDLEAQVLGKVERMAAGERTTSGSARGRHPLGLAATPALAEDPMTVEVKRLSMDTALKVARRRPSPPAARRASRSA
jgi:5-(carboxyamino)imidazole ribonucleotide mutase